MYDSLDNPDSILYSGSLMVIALLLQPGPLSQYVYYFNLIHFSSMYYFFINATCNYLVWFSYSDSLLFDVPLNNSNSLFLYVLCNFSDTLSRRVFLIINDSLKLYVYFISLLLFLSLVYIFTPNSLYSWLALMHYLSVF